MKLMVCLAQGGCREELTGEAAYKLIGTASPFTVAHPSRDHESSMPNSRRMTIDAVKI